MISKLLYYSLLKVWNVVIIMVINMSESLFNELIKLCKSSKKELSGTMRVKVSGEYIYSWDKFGFNWFYC